MASKGDVRVSVNLHSPAVSAASEDRETVQNSPGASVDPSGVVATHSQQPAENETDSVPSGTASATPASLGSQSFEPQSGKSLSGVPGEERPQTLGFSDNVIKRIGKSRASSTRKHYWSQWDLFGAKTEPV